MRSLRYNPRHALAGHRLVARLAASSGSVTDGPGADPDSIRTGGSLDGAFSHAARCQHSSPRRDSAGKSCDSDRDSISRCIHEQHRSRRTAISGSRVGVEVCRSHGGSGNGIPSRRVDFSGPGSDMRPLCHNFERRAGQVSSTFRSCEHAIGGFGMAVRALYQGACRVYRAEARYPSDLRGAPTEHAGRETL